MAQFQDTPAEKQSFISQLIEAIQKALYETGCEKSGKSIRWYRVRHSVRFQMPKEIKQGVTFKKGEPQTYFQPSHSEPFDHVVCYVPFTVEKVGEREFIARD